MDEGEFHLEDGLHFKRLESGEVQIRWENDGEDGFTEQKVVTVSPESWASVVSSVSHRGEDGDTFREALKFHNGEAE